MKKVFLFSLVYLLSVVTVVAQQKDNKQQVQKTKVENSEVPSGYRAVFGKVVDQEGLQLIGVTIRLKGTDFGTTTDVNGEFKLFYPVRKHPVIIVSYIGMVTEEISLGDDASKDKARVIKLKEDAVMTDEVVITGYSNINKKSFTGNSVQIKKEDLLKVSKTNVFSALQAFDPSFRIQENSQWGSDPNAIPELYIRGRSGIGIKELDSETVSKSNLQNNPNLPLFIMDGFEVSATKLYDLDPNRIENITILKDAAATAMYGSRAANGIVVITTVPPKPGKLQIDYSMTGTLQMPDLSDYNLMNASEKLETERLAGFYIGKDAGEQYTLDREYYGKLQNVKRGVDTDWISQPVHSVFNHKHSLSLTGGTENLRFSVDLSYNKSDGVMRGSYRDRTGGGLALDYRIGRLQVRNYVSYSSTRSKESPYGSFSDYTTKLPYDTFRDDDGDYVTKTTEWHNLGMDNLANPLYEATLKSYDRSNADEFIDNLSANWYINDHWQIKGQFALTKSYSESRRFLDPLSAKNTDALSSTNKISGELTTSSGNSLSWDMNAFLAYNRTIKEHNINLSVGINATSSSGTSTSARYMGFPSGDFDSPNYAQKIYEKPDWSDTKSRLFGALATLNYSYQNIYLLDASVRSDGSSEFGSDNKTALFWSFGLGLALHNYEFIKKLSFIDEFKIRGTYGSSGKVNFEPFAAKTVYEINGDEWYETGMGANMIAMGNVNLGWETTYQTDFGFELGLLKRLFYISFAYYNKRTVDLVNDVTIPSSTGFTSYKDNVGEMQNRGYEFNVRSNIIRRRDMQLSLFANLGHNENKLVKISNSLKAYNDLVDHKYAELGNYDADAAKPFRKYEEGVSTTAISAVKSHGIDPATGKEIFEKRDGTLTTKWDSADMISCCDTEPDIQGTFGFNFSWKKFSLYTTFMYEYGGQRYNSTLVSKVENADIYNSNVDKRVLSDRWKEPGDNARFKALYNGKNSIEITKSSTRFIEDYNLLSLNSITLGYTFGAEQIKKLGLSMLRLEIGANDLARFCTVKQERGLSYPYSRSVNFTVNASF